MPSLKFLFLPVFVGCFLGASTGKANVFGIFPEPFHRTVLCGVLNGGSLDGVDVSQIAARLSSLQGTAICLCDVSGVRETESPYRQSLASEFIVTSFSRIEPRNPRIWVASQCR